MSSFEIKKGKSTNLFDSNGNCILSPDNLVEGHWYLTTDTAEVYVALRQPNEELVLRKINECNIDVDFDFEEFDSRLTALEQQERVHTYGYRNLFPTEDNAIEGDMYVAVDEGITYVFFNNSYRAVSGSAIEPNVIFGGTAD